MAIGPRFTDRLHKSEMGQDECHSSPTALTNILVGPDLFMDIFTFILDSYVDRYANCEHSCFGKICFCIFIIEINYSQWLDAHSYSMTIVSCTNG